MHAVYLQPSNLTLAATKGGSRQDFWERLPTRWFRALFDLFANCFRYGWVGIVEEYKFVLSGGKGRGGAYKRNTVCFSSCYEKYTYLS